MESKRWTRGLVAATSIWVAGAVAGVATAAQPMSTLVAAEAPGERLEGFAEARRQDIPPARLCIGIFGRNLAVYLWLLCGLISCGLTTVALLAFNGVALGQIAGLALGAGMPLERLALLTLPHLIPEIGAFLLAGAIGLRGPALLSAWFRGTFGGAPLAGVLRPAAGGIVCIAIAAAIEVYVTVAIAQAGIGS